MNSKDISWTLSRGGQTKGMTDIFYIKGWKGGVVFNDVVLNSVGPEYDINGME